MDAEPPTPPPESFGAFKGSKCGPFSNHLQLPQGFTVFALVCVRRGFLPPSSQALPVFLTLLVNPWVLLPKEPAAAATPLPAKPPAFLMHALQSAVSAQPAELPLPNG